MTGFPLFKAISLLTADQVAAEVFPPDSPVAALRRYWLSIVPGPGLLPGRRHMDPLDIAAAIMPWIFLLDVVAGDTRRFDYVFRLVGTGNVSLVGRDATGERASRLFDRVAAPFVMETFDTTVTGGVPTFWIATVPHDRFGDVTIHRGLFPLAQDGRTVDMLLCIAAPWPAA